MTRIYCFGIASQALEGCNIPSALPFNNPEALHISGLTVIIAPIEVETLPPRRRYMRAHTELLEALNRIGTALPMRFGVIAPDLSGLKRAIETKRDHLLSLLMRLEGFVEYSITISTNRERFAALALESSPSLLMEQKSLKANGRINRMTAMRFGQRLSDAMSDLRRKAENTIMEALRPAIADAILRAPEEDHQLLRADLLIHHHNEKAFEDFITDLTTRLRHSIDKRNQVHAAWTNEELRVRIIGPAPLFNFAECHIDLPQKSVKMS
ncbi:MAG: GvpL/GvpF family gas vesicle protein [Pseudomonadota bacterium]